MPRAFVWKPSSTGRGNPGGLSVVLGQEDWAKSVDILGQGGNVLESLQRSPWGDPSRPERPGMDPMQKWFTNKPGSSYGQNVTVRVTYADGRVENYPIENAGQYYRGTLGDPSSLRAGTPPGGAPGQFAPGTMGQFGAYPAYLGGMFPSPSFATFKSIRAAPYKFTDPFDFAQRYGEFSREEMKKTAGTAQDIALGQLETELEGLRTYVPAAAALKRSETALDNIFNQAQRTAQIQGTLPEVPGQLAAQGQRAETYAAGRLPDSIQDRALELGIRSRAADTAYGGGFGTQSSAARKVSDLMSAEQRFQIGQYGEQLLTSNIGTKANLLLAPTEYANVGSQINVMPSLSGSQLAQTNLDLGMRYGAIPATTAFSSEINQQQFRTSQIQNTRQFNAANQLETSMFNAGVANQFSLGLFGYNAAYASALAGASQTDINANLGLQQQQQAQDIFSNLMGQTQNQNTIRDAIAGLTAIGSAFATRQPQPGGGVEGGGGSAPGTPDFVGPPLPEGAPGTPDFVGPPLPEGAPGTPDFVGPPLPEGAPGTPDFVGPPAPDMPVTQAAMIQGPRSLERGQSLDAHLASGEPGGILPQHLATPLAMFSRDTGTRLGGYIPLQYARQGAAALVGGGERVLQTAGVYNRPAQGRVSVGYNDRGMPQYSDARLMRNPDIRAGRVLADTTAQVIEPFGGLTGEDGERFREIGRKAGDPVYISKLDALHNAGDMKAFMKELQKFTDSLKPKPKRKEKEKEERRKRGRPRKRD